MRLLSLTSVMLLAVTSAASWSFGDPAVAAPLADPGPEARIIAVLVREKDVLATDGMAIYRGSPADKRWRAVPTPADMPLEGAFVVPPAEQVGSNTVLFCAPPPDLALVIDDPKTGATHLVTGDAARANNQRYGIYRSADGGETWKLLSDTHDFQFVFWHPDGTLYALAGKKGFVNPTRVYRSKDSGVTWDDITHNLADAGYGGLVSIFRDPDHPALACLTAQGVRGYVIHADDDTYQWTGEQESTWERKHQTDEKFLGTNYGFAGIESISDYLFTATFGNYFSHPFGNQTSIDAFELRTEKSDYAFDLHGPKPVRVTMRFRPTDHPAVSYDLDFGTDFWGVRVIDPASRHIAVAPKVEERASNDKDAQKQYEQRKDLRTVKLTSEHPYDREVDLEKIFTFPAPGVYRVQLVYASPWWAAKGRAHWTGSFGSNVMLITIR